MKNGSLSDIRSLVRKNILNMKPYSSARDDFRGDADIFLDANENPYPSPFNRYPDPLQREVKARLAKLKGVKPGQIFLGNGSDEAIDLLIRAFCDPGRNSILITDPTYGMYSVCADVNAVNVQKTILNSEFDIDTGSLNEAIDSTTKIIMLCSPNNPTGNLLDRNKIIAVIRGFGGLVVIDEAYIDFSSGKSFIEELPSFPNLVILQTFSKAWGLAGLRLGIAFASEEIISIMNRIKYPYNVNIKSQELAVEALENPLKKDLWVREILEQRQQLSNELKKVRTVEKIFPSDANFLLVRVKDAPATYEFLMNKGIIVRDRSKVTLCHNCLRITVGTPEENQTLISALKEL